MFKFLGHLFFGTNYNLVGHLQNEGKKWENKAKFAMDDAGMWKKACLGLQERNNHASRLLEESMIETKRALVFAIKQNGGELFVPDLEQFDEDILIYDDRNNRGRKFYLREEKDDQQNNDHNVQ